MARKFKMRKRTKSVKKLDGRKIVTQSAANKAYSKKFPNGKGAPSWVERAPYGQKQEYVKRWWQNEQDNKLAARIAKKEAISVKRAEVKARQEATLEYLQGYKSGVIKKNSLDSLADMQKNNKLVHKNMKTFDRDIRALEKQGWVNVETQVKTTAKITSSQRFQTSFKNARTIYVRPTGEVLDHDIKYKLMDPYSYRPVQKGKSWALEVDKGFGYVPVQGARFKSKGNAFKGAIAISRNFRERYTFIPPGTSRKARGITPEKWIGLNRTPEQFKRYKEQALKPLTKND